VAVGVVWERPCEAGRLYRTLLLFIWAKADPRTQLWVPIQPTSRRFTGWVYSMEAEQVHAGQARPAGKSLRLTGSLGTLGQLLHNLTCKAQEQRWPSTDTGHVRKERSPNTLLAIIR
jgi:hypothetical protein